jgi:hypothetical protein
MPKSLGKWPFGTFTFSLSMVIWKNVLDLLLTLL